MKNDAFWWIFMDVEEMPTTKCSMNKINIKLIFKLYTRHGKVIRRKYIIIYSRYFQAEELWAISSFFSMCSHIFKTSHNCKILILYSEKFFLIKKESETCRTWKNSVDKISAVLAKRPWTQSHEISDKKHESRLLGPAKDAEEDTAN